MSKLFGYAGYGAFGVALMATLTSLLMSELFNMVPCSLCWYQRIFMYPLVIVIGLGIMRRDNNWMLTTLILSGIGWVVALYHTLLQWSIIPESMAPCVAGVSCAEQEINLLGFITLPFLSLMAFTAIIVMTVVFQKGVQHEQRV